MKRLHIIIAAVAAMLTVPAMANEYADQLNALVDAQLKQIASDPGLVAAVKAQNEVTDAYDQAQIDALDQQWRAEVDASDKPLIDEVLANDASAYLSGVLEQSQGMFTEIFATDARGLNVGQSGITSDYWQGDEAKWQNPFENGVTDIGDVEQDESTQEFQTQVSIPVVDESGAAIGAITFGVNAEYL